MRLDIFIFQTENKTGQQRRSTVPCVIVSFHNSRRELKTDAFLLIERSNDQDPSLPIVGTILEDQNIQMFYLSKRSNKWELYRIRII